MWFDVGLDEASQTYALLNSYDAEMLKCFYEKNAGET